MNGWQPMRVRLKGLNRVRKRLADGRTVTYWYAWKSGPALPGKPGSPEFVDAYNQAIAERTQPPHGVLLSVLQPYQASPDFEDLASSTRRSYVPLIKRIERSFGDFPLTALTDRRTRGLDRGLVAANPCERGGRLYRASRSDKIWTEVDEAAFLTKAPKHLHLPLVLALWTGQRQGDLLRLPWSAYDGTHIRLRQGKTGARIVIPVGAPLKAALDATQRRSTLILASTENRSWTSDGFRSSWRKACAAAGVTGVTFHDLRGTAVTRLALAGCTEAEIASITGHSLRDVGAILDAHYLHRDPKLAGNANRQARNENEISQLSSQLVWNVPTNKRLSF